MPTSVINLETFKINVQNKKKIMNIWGDMFYLV